MALIKDYFLTGLVESDRMFKLESTLAPERQNTRLLSGVKQAD